MSDDKVVDLYSKRKPKARHGKTPTEVLETALQAINDGIIAYVAVVSLPEDMSEEFYEFSEGCETPAMIGAMTIASRALEDVLAGDADPDAA